MPFLYLTHGDREGYKQINLKNNNLIKKKKCFFFFCNNKSVRIASYVRKPVKTMEIRKTYVKNVQIDTSAFKEYCDFHVTLDYANCLTPYLSATPTG